MTTEKRHLVDLPRCYATTAITIQGEPTIMLATEGEGAAYAWSGPDYSVQRTIWEGPGGTMSMVPIPGRDGEFLAIQKFFKLFQWDEAIIVWVKPQADGTFATRQILHLPYIHRFDLFQVDDGILFLGCTLAEAKDTRDDWSRAGKAYAGVLPGDWDTPLQVRVLKDGLFRNHGYARSAWNGRTAGLITSDEGAFAFVPPRTVAGEWAIERFMDWQISDIAACDIDGDGEPEYATIEPWHGQYFRIYKKIDGRFRKIWEHPEVSEFYHVVTGATLRGRQVFIGGCRRGTQQLFYVQSATPSMDTAVAQHTASPHGTTPPAAALEAVIIDSGVGPSNIAVINEPGRDIIVSANREKGEAALYIIKE